MSAKTLFSLSCLAGILLLAGCGSGSAIPTAAEANPNPASVHCEEQGYTLEIVTADDGSQSGQCVFPDGSSCDEWAFYRGECKAPASQDNQEPASSTAIPTAMPVDPAIYQGWWTYTHPVHGFSIRLPEDWVVDEATASDPLMNGHLLMLHPRAEAEEEIIRLTFRVAGEDVLLWPTGVGSGEFISQGSLEVGGQGVNRVLFVCPGGNVGSIYYHQSESEPNIRRGDLEFGILFRYAECSSGLSLEGKLQQTGEGIIASLQVP